MSFKIKLAGRKKVNAEFNGFTVYTDQPLTGGGEGTAPAPFEMFLASLGTCAGIYIVGFCESRGLDSTGIEIELKLGYDPVKRGIGQVNLEIQVPPEFPDKYHASLVNTANLCAVKKFIENPPVFNTYTVYKD